MLASASLRYSQLRFSIIGFAYNIGSAELCLPPL